jgi:signal transduction histidine kinase/CheY-like chemotaxis protein
MTNGKTTPAPTGSPESRRVRRRARSLRVALGWLVAAVLLPLVAAGAAFLVKEWKQQREAAVARLQDSARTLRRAVDRELTLDQAVLRTLAESGEIDRRDWRSFHFIAAKAAAARPESWFVLYDRADQTIVNTRVPFGAGPLPNFRALNSSRPEAEWEGRRIPMAGGLHHVPFETGTPSFSGLIYSPVLKRPAVGTNMPVIREGTPVYGLSLVYSSRFYEHLLERESAPGLTSAVFDARGRIIARNRDSERFVGLPGPAPFHDGIAALPREGVGETTTIDSIRFVYAYSRSGLADVVVGVGMPKAAVLAPAWRALWVWLGVLAFAAGGGAFVAVWLWRRVGTPLAALAQQARTLGDARPAPVRSGIQEVEALRTALDDAAKNEQVRREVEREREEARRELHRANAKLVEADRRKDEFLGMLSHELRNPLAPIRNSTYILRHAAPGSEQARRAQAVIERQTEHLTRLVDDLLDVTRIARGKIELRRSRVDLRELLCRATDDFRLMMDGRDVAFRAALPDAKVWVDADATRITQIVGNLLHNAAKFTRRGDEVMLSLETEGGEATIRVRDTGAGIDPALLPRLFAPFVQGERTLARTEGGLGLGLALVKGIAELHGGTVGVESAGKGKGAEFVVRLPAVEVAAAQQAADARRTHRESSRRRVLVVDDDTDAAESLAEIVGMLGHEVEIAYDGPSAIEKARANRPDVVLCDIELPGMSGHEVANALREGGNGAQLFAVSGYAQPEDVKKAIEAGFDGHLAKPLNIVDVERLLG